MDAKIAFITGASRGIGRAIAVALAEDGYDIWLNCNSDLDGVHETAGMVSSFGRECEIIRFDVSLREEVEHALEQRLKFACPDVLVNNAGIAKDSVFGLMSGQAWDAVLSVSLDGFFNVTRQILPHMLRRRRGRIISISSISGQAGNPGQVNYSAAKAGLIGASKALAREVGKREILVNVVAPGVIETSMSDKLPVEKIIDEIPLHRLGKPEDVAGVVRFLCSPWANYITGQVIAVNGGMYC